MKRATCSGRDLSGEKGLWARFFPGDVTFAQFPWIAPVCTGAVCLSVPSKNITRASKNTSISVLRRSAGDTLPRGFSFFFLFPPPEANADSPATRGVRPLDPRVALQSFLRPSPPKSPFFVNSNSFFSFFFPSDKDSAFSLCAENCRCLRARNQRHCGWPRVPNSEMVSANNFCHTKSTHLSLSLSHYNVEFFKTVWTDR